jgi:hypothetical protein
VRYHIDPLSCVKSNLFIEDVGYYQLHVNVRDQRSEIRGQSIQLNFSELTHAREVFTCADGKVVNNANQVVAFFDQVLH